MAAPIYEAETPRLYLERLSEDKHLEDFHEQWNTDEGVIWSYVTATPRTPLLQFPLKNKKIN